MKPFADTKAGWKRLKAVCQEVRIRLGLGGLCYTIVRGKSKKHHAHYYTPGHGWRVTICFHPSFFTESFRTQLEIIVHEHLHAAMTPADQVVFRFMRKMKGPKREAFEEAYEGACEIVVDHAAAWIADMLMPHIKKVV